MASSGDRNFNAAACFRGLPNAQMPVISAASATHNSQPFRRQDEGFGGEGSVVARKLERRRGLLNIDLNVAPPPEAADCEFEAEEGGNEPETPPAEDSVIKADVSDEGEANFNAEVKTAEIGGDAEEERRNIRWIALLGVAENALREKKEEEIRKRKRGGEAAGEARKRIGFDGQRRLVADWNRDSSAEVVVRSTRGRAVAMPRKYSDSVLGSAAVELPRYGKSGTVFCIKRKSR